MEVGDLKKAKRIFRESSHVIDAEHQEAREASLEKIEELNPLFHFRNTLSFPK